MSVWRPQCFSYQISQDVEILFPTEHSVSIWLGLINYSSKQIIHIKYTTVSHQFLRYYLNHGILISVSHFKFDLNSIKLGHPDRLLPLLYIFKNHIDIYWWAYFGFNNLLWFVIISRFMFSCNSLPEQLTIFCVMFQMSYCLYCLAK